MVTRSVIGRNRKIFWQFGKGLHVAPSMVLNRSLLKLCLILITAKFQLPFEFYAFNIGAMMERTQVIMVRHGETEWNLKLICQGHLDSHMTERGLAEEIALGERLTWEHFYEYYRNDSDG